MITAGTRKRCAKRVDPSANRTDHNRLRLQRSFLGEPLFEFLKLSFTEWPFNETNTPFLSVVEIWLAYIQLWKLPEHGQESNDRQRILKWCVLTLPA